MGYEEQQTKWDRQEQEMQQWAREWLKLPEDATRDDIERLLEAEMKRRQ